MTPATENKTQDLEDLTADYLTQHVIKTCTQNVQNERTRDLISGLIQHLHDYVREVKLKPGEWETGVQYLTKVRQMKYHTHFN
jgi:ribosomal protein S15P/S13E